MLKSCRECGGALTHGKYCSTHGCPNECVSEENDMSKMSNLDVEMREMKTPFIGRCKICGKKARNWYPMESGQPHFCDKHDPYPISRKRKVFKNENT
jgi:reverse gyrase